SPVSRNVRSVKRTLSTIDSLFPDGESGLEVDGGHSTLAVTPGKFNTSPAPTVRTGISLEDRVSENFEYSGSRLGFLATSAAPTEKFRATSFSPSIWSASACVARI